MVRKWKQEDDIKLRKELEIMVPSAIQEILGYKIAYRIPSSSIMHTELQPEGLKFTIQIVVDAYKHKEKKKDDTTGDT